MTKFTKGLWYFSTEPSSKEICTIYNIPTSPKGYLYIHSDETVEISEKKHNANLIASAPDLYEALSALYNEWDDTYDGEPMSVELIIAYELARKALAKARGES